MRQRTSNSVGRDIERGIEEVNRERHERGRSAARSESRAAVPGTAKERHSDKDGSRKPSGIERTSKRVSIGSDATHRTEHGRADIALASRRSRPET